MSPLIGNFACVLYRMSLQLLDDAGECDRRRTESRPTACAEAGEARSRDALRLGSSVG